MRFALGKVDNAHSSAADLAKNSVRPDAVGHIAAGRLTSWRKRHGEEGVITFTRIEQRQHLSLECRFFGGMTEEETAQALDVTSRTVRSDWVKARGWLRQALAASD
jgi:hypothetical protein